MPGKSKSCMYRDTVVSHNCPPDASPEPGGSESDSVERGHSPLNFDMFIPWACKQWCVIDTVTVIKLQEEPLLSLTGKKSATIKRKSVVGDSFPEIKQIPSSSKKTTLPNIPIRAYYDSQRRLVEIAIINCPIKIPRKVIQAISLCMPFHPMLTRLTVPGRGLSHYIIYEIKKLLPLSNLTNICLDDSYIPQGNYYILLEQPSTLSYLSLKRCKINDDVCKKIAMQLVFGNPAANFLRALELASNNITDIGTQYLGTALRSNRYLMHLNLADNKITDEGGSALLDSLMEFRLTSEEVVEMKRRKFRYLESKKSAYERCVTEVLQQMENSLHAGKSVELIPAKLVIAKKSSRKSTAICQSAAISTSLKPEECAAKMANEIIGEFIYPFTPASTILVDKCYYAKGNFVLCSLNLAYNDLRYSFIQKLDEVVTYQSVTIATASGSNAPDGLLRVVVEGNLLPEKCDEFDHVEFLLGIKLMNRGKTSSSTFRAKSRSVRQHVTHSKNS